MEKNPPSPTTPNQEEANEASPSPVGKLPQSAARQEAVTDSSQSTTTSTEPKRASLSVKADKPAAGLPSTSAARPKRASLLLQGEEAQSGAKRPSVSLEGAETKAESISGAQPKRVSLPLAAEEAKTGTTLTSPAQPKKASLSLEEETRASPAQPKRVSLPLEAEEAKTGITLTAPAQPKKASLSLEEETRASPAQPKRASLPLAAEEAKTGTTLASPAQSKKASLSLEVEETRASPAQPKKASLSLEEETKASPPQSKRVSLPLAAEDAKTGTTLASPAQSKKASLSLEVEETRASPAQPKKASLSLEGEEIRASPAQPKRLSLPLEEEAEIKSARPSVEKEFKSTELVESEQTGSKTVSKLRGALSSRKSSRKSIDKSDREASISFSEEPKHKISAVTFDISDAEGMDSGSRKKSSVYNPFTSFEKRVSIADTGRDIQQPFKETASPRLSVKDMQLKGLATALNLASINTIPSRSNSLRSQRRRSVSVADLTKQDIAVCFFPEEPDWSDDEDNDDEFRMVHQAMFSRELSQRVLPFLKDDDYWDDREQWSSRLVYLIATIAYSISFNNFYHFPMLVYHYGGIPFIIPYTLFTIFMGYPLHFLETSLGQYSQLGPVKVWDCAPVARGIGLSMVFLCLFIGYFYNMFASYSVIYFSRCFNSILPWHDCDSSTGSAFYCLPRMCNQAEISHYTPGEHYFLDHVLWTTYQNKILENGLGPMIWKQVLGLFLAWVIVYAATIQSVRSIGKVVPYFVIFPYFVLLMLLAASFMLDGSNRGLAALFGANFDKMADIQLWRSAAEQVFFELGICQGTPLAFGSYSHHRNPAHIDSAIVCIFNYLTSILCAVVVFNILGTLSMEMQTQITDIIHHEPALVYVTYPEIISRIPGSNFWCVLFFFVLFSICIGTQIAVIETILTVIYDEFKGARPYRWLINLAFCSALFFIGIILCTSNGYFIVYLLYRMVAMMPRLPIAICMVSTIAFIYGMKKYCEDMQFMLNYYPIFLVRFCLFVTPFLLLALTIPSWILIKPISIMGQAYTRDAVAVGWAIIGFILIWIILGGIYWLAYCSFIGHPNYVWKSLASWGPRNSEAQFARAEFSSEPAPSITARLSKKYHA